MGKQTTADAAVTAAAAALPLKRERSQEGKRVIIIIERNSIDKVASVCQCLQVCAEHTANHLRPHIHSGAHYSPS